jgi:uncharacterized membrane protein YhhN
MKRGIAVLMKELPPMQLTIVITAMWIFVAAQIYFEYRCRSGHPGAGVGITKTAASLLFLTAGILCAVHSQQGGRLLLLGLVLCVLGDIFLISQKRMLFLLGLTSFLLAHLLYCCAFIAMNGNLYHTVIAAPMVFGAGIVIARKLLPHMDAKMKKPVIAYLITICVMVALAFSMTLKGGLHLVAAAVLFMISDVFTARDRFMKPSFHNRLLGLPLYYGAQLIFACSSLL